MTLNPQPSYPSGRSYVLKLHRDALAQKGTLCGRLEHIASGRIFDFNGADELLARLAEDIATVLSDTQSAARL